MFNRFNDTTKLLGYGIMAGLCVIGIVNNFGKASFVEFGKFAQFGAYFTLGLLGHCLYKLVGLSCAIGIKKGNVELAESKKKLEKEKQTVKAKEIEFKKMDPYYDYHNMSRDEKIALLEQEKAKLIAESCSKVEYDEGKGTYVVIPPRQEKIHQQ